LAPREVFISYSRSDRQYVEALTSYLSMDGIVCWYDHEVLRGQRFDQVLAGKIEQCAAFIVVMTPAAAESSWVANEISHATSNGKPILPLLLDGRPLLPVASLDREDVQNGQMPSREFVARLVAVVNAESSQSGEPAELPVSSNHGVAPSDDRVPFTGDHWDGFSPDDTFGFLVRQVLFCVVGLALAIYPLLDWSAWGWIFLIAGLIAPALVVAAVARIWFTGSPYPIVVVTVGAGILAGVAGIGAIIALGVALWKIFADHQGVGWLAPALAAVAVVALALAAGTTVWVLASAELPDTSRRRQNAAAAAVVKLHLRRSSWLGRNGPPAWAVPLLARPSVRGFCMSGKRFTYALAAGWDLLVFDDSGMFEDEAAIIAIREWVDLAEDVFARVRPHFFAIVPAQADGLPRFVTVDLPRFINADKVGLVVTAEHDLGDLCGPIIARGRPMLWLPLLTTLGEEAKRPVWPPLRRQAGGALGYGR
jgi:hypothetical protein